MLRRIDQDLWCLDSHFKVWGMRGSVRMTVIRTPAGLLLYSPVYISPEMKSAIEALGPVAVIMAPNLYHHLFLRSCMALFPQARVLVPDGLADKIGALAKAEVMARETVLDPDGSLDHFVFSGHGLRETLLFHRPSATLVTADMLYNFQEEQHAAEKLFYRCIGCYGAPKLAFYHRFSIRDKADVGRLISTVETWRPRRIIMSHGRIVEGDDCAAIFSAAWRTHATS